MLEKIIHQEIKEKGPISQSRFMELALQHPTYGYYRSKEAVSRDFTTAPEISQMFGELIGVWGIDSYTKLKEPQRVNLVELGPGKGTLMADFLRVAKLSKSFLEALQITLVEINPLLKATQQKTISSPIQWIETFEELPPSRDPLIIIANEFFDALPVNCFTRKENTLFERRLDIQEGTLTFTYHPLRLDPGPDQIWEENPSLESTVKNICQRLLKQKGVFLCIDYGYEKGEGESLQALYQGEISDPLSHIGKSDLTCHVNFGKIKEIASSHGLDVIGPIPQGQFLKSIGLDIRLEKLKHNNPSQKASLDIAATRLTHPQQMGELFKVIIIASPIGSPS